LLNRREEALLKDLGPARFRTADAWPLVGVGAPTLVIALSLLAWNLPESFLFVSMPAPDETGWTPDPDSDIRAGAFLVVGFLLLAFSWLLARQRSSLLDRTARGLRWIIPSYILLPLAWLEYHDDAPGWGLWFVLLPLAALGAVFASAAQQWKPFMLTGLVYLAEWYVRAFDRLRSDEHDRGILLMTSMGVVGLAVMVAAWFATRSRPYLDPARTVADAEP
jgi:hypothetical protein